MPEGVVPVPHRRRRGTTARDAAARTGWKRRERRAARVPVDYTTLPERVDPADLGTAEPVEPAPDPRGGRDTETEFMLRNAGLF